MMNWLKKICLKFKHTKLEDIKIKYPYIILIVSVFLVTSFLGCEVKTKYFENECYFVAPIYTIGAVFFPFVLLFGYFGKVVTIIMSVLLILCMNFHNIKTSDEEANLLGKKISAIASIIFLINIFIGYIMLIITLVYQIGI